VAVANEWSSALTGVVGQQKITPVSSATTRPNTAGDVNGLSRDAIEALPVAVCMTDAEGRLTFYNEAAAAFWGCRPELGETKFCGSWKLYWPDGTRLPHDQCPMAMALHQRRQIRGIEAVAERPDGTRISFIPYPTPLFDEAGRLTGAVNMLVDISERKRVEANLAERKAQLATVEARRELVDSEARFRATFENAAVGVALVGTDGSILRANNCFARMLGYSVEELKAKTFQALTHPDDLATNLSVLNKTLVGEADSYSMEKRYVRKDGVVVWASLTVGCVRKTEGGVDYLVSVVQDITARKQAEERLQKGERKLRELLGALPAAVYVTDAAGHITYCNQSAIDLWGFEPALGKDKWCDVSKFYYADGSPMPLADCPTEIALKQGRVAPGREAIIERKDGTRIPIAPYPTPLHDDTGAIVGVVNMTVDISERKKAELALAERNIQLALAGKAGLVGSYAYDADTEFMQISAGYAAIHGFPEGTTELARSECLAHVHLDDIGRVELCRSEAFRELRREYNVEYRIIRPGGELRWVETRCFISFDGEGHPHRVVGVSIDITERKRVEEHQHTLLAELDHRVKNALATVSAVVSQTRQESRSVADFAAVLDGRIRSMATTHELLSSRGWHGVSLTELVQRELAPYTSRNNTEIGGPEVTLSARAGQVVSMVLHELATNGAKHGALSVPDGRIFVRWQGRVNGNADAPVVLEWQETGGPTVQPPDTTGYGMEVIRDLIPYELGGRVDLTFPADGLCCRLEIPAKGAAYLKRS
jgi:PAS domain S-box-containing protein